MKFQKKINNNVAWALTENGEEVIVIGKGVSFGKEKGQKIPSAEIEKFYYSDEKKDHMMDTVISEISEDIFSLTEDILNSAKETLAIKEINVSNFISLAGHLDYALKRSSEDMIDYPDNLKWEIRRLYPKEYEFTLDTLFLIEKKTAICLPKSELTFLTYHFVNLQYGMNVKRKSYELSELLNQALKIIQYHYQIILDQNSINYIRFMTHLRHFLLRQMNHEYEEQNVIDKNLMIVVKTNYQKAYQAAEKVSHMIETKYSCRVIEDEKFYLTLHIERVTNSNN